MLNLIADITTSGDIAGFIAVGIAVFVTFFVVAVTIAVKRMKSSRNSSASVPRRNTESTEQQSNNNARDFAAALRERKEKMSKAEQRQRATIQNDCDDAYHTHEGDRVVANSDGHAHNADNEERYDKIVGSLGEVDDEGCLDLDGVRLIVDDVAYSVDTESRDYSEIAKAVVLGDIINNPRFKTTHRKR